MPNLDGIPFREDNSGNSDKTRLPECEYHNDMTPAATFREYFRGNKTDNLS